MSDSPTFADFNPTSNETVAAIKAKTDELIAIVKGIGGDSRAERRKAIAITRYEGAAMWAVKAIFS